MKTKLIKTASGMEVEKDGKSYKVRPENEEGFRIIALRNYYGSNFIYDLSKGILLSNEKVRIESDCKSECEKSLTKKCICPDKYATLVTDDKKEEGQEEFWGELIDLMDARYYDKAKQKFKIERR